MDGKKLKTVPLNKIKISDQFWNRYIHLVKDVLIPYQWDILNDRLPDVETSHCIENFKIAAGVVSLKRLLNQSNLKSWSSKMIKKSLEAYFFTLKNKIVFCKKQFQNMSVFCFVSTEIV